MSVSSLEPRIRQILAAPGTDLNTISAKRVRKQLLDIEPSITEDWVKANKSQIDLLIASVFESVSGAAAVQGGTKRERSDEDDYDHVNGSVGDGDDDGDDDDEGPSTPPPKAKKQKTKKELTDEEYARQLSSELNGRTSRTSRSGKASNGKTKKGASRTPKRNKKSAEHIDDSEDGSDAEPDSGKKRKKTGGGAKGGFGKEFILSEPLSAVLGVDRLSRPQVVKQLWIYIKANELQNPSDKREILCDEMLRPVFNTDKVDMFKMNKILGQHLHEEE